MSATIFESYDYDVYGGESVKDGDGTTLTESAYGNRLLFQDWSYDYTNQFYNFLARWTSNDHFAGPGLTWRGKSGRLSG